MIGIAMVGRNRARYLAPIALAATLVATYIIAQGAVSGKHSTTHSHVRHSRGHGQFANATFYTVQPGDSMTSIAAKTGVRLSTLEALNPNVDPNALQTAQRLRLRR